ncbi:MAG: zf-HC2 domain-containing protein [Nocardioidaceae bacterium]|nr:MAG: zf-HC2 domain-containing protein [Nocardioidaceae bacterium]
MFDLGFRHGLTDREIARISDEPTPRVEARRATVFQALQNGAGPVAVAGASSCPNLLDALSDWDGELSSAWARRMRKHIDGCEFCSVVEQTELSPGSVRAALPLEPAPGTTRALVFPTTGDVAAVAAAVSIAADPFDATGFPPQEGEAVVFDISPDGTRAARSAACRCGGSSLEERPSSRS